ncbi:MAG: efflux RND transporter periplasmic adaptor subunit [Candidatus Binatia bacterium]
MMKRRLPSILANGLMVAVALVIVAAALWFWLRPAQVTTAEVSVREIRPAVQGVGSVEAKLVVALAAKITGRISAMNVDQGDVVRISQVLVKLENSELSAEVARAAANLERVKFALLTQEAAVLRAQAGLAAADAAIAKARSNQLLAQTNAERWRKLAATDLVAPMDLDERLNAAKSADAELRSAEALREAAAKDVSAQEIALKAVPQDIAAGAAALASARARNAETTMASPIDGIVISRELELGAAVNPGTPILKLADPASIWVTVFVDERDAGPIARGNAANVTLRSMPGRAFHGKVVRIRRESDRVTEQLTVDISVEEPPERLTIGQQAEATIRPAARRVTALPLAAVVQSAKGAGAWTVVDGRMRFRRASLGIVDPAGWIEVIEGFTGGEQVMVAPGKLADLKNEGRRVAGATQRSDTIAAAKQQP